MTMSGSQLTEERLRSWLDANQVQRERLCMAVLALNEHYSNVRPRRPKGGPDGARDIEAELEGGAVVWGAVGFRNGAKDSKEDKTWARHKFEADLNAALDRNPDLHGFVFLTNLDLTPSEVDELVAMGRKKGLLHVEVFYRERLRMALDAPAGLGFRYQFLGIPLSDAEQAAFFERFGSDLERLVRDEFRTVDRKLARLEFFHDSEKNLHNLSFWLNLAAPVGPEELGHFRFLLEILDLNERDPHPSLWLAGRDAYPELVSGEERTKLPGTKMICWSRNPDDSIQSTVIGHGMGPVIQGLSSFTGVYGKGPFVRLKDLEHKHLNIFVTTPLADRIASLGLIANDYSVISMPASELVLKPGNPLAEWPEDLSETEAAVPWTNVFLKGDDPSLPPPAWPIRTWFLNFASYTPEKMREVE